MFPVGVERGTRRMLAAGAESGGEGFQLHVSRKALVSHYPAGSLRRGEETVGRSGDCAGRDNRLCGKMHRFPSVTPKRSASLDKPNLREKGKR